MSRYFRYFPTTTYLNRVVTDITRRVKIIEDLRADPYAFLPYTIKEGDRAEDVARYYYGDENRVWMVYLSNNIVDPYTQWPLSNSDLEKTVLKKYSRDPVKFSSSDIDASVISMTAHGFSTTDPVVYTSSGSVASPLVNGTTYYVIKVDDNRVRLATSAANAKVGTSITLTGTGGTSQSLELNAEVFINSTTIDTNILYAENITTPGIFASTDTYLAYPAQWRPVRVYEYEIDLNESKRTIWLVNNLYANQLEQDLIRSFNV